VIYTDAYGQKWPRKPDALRVEFNMIRRVWAAYLARQKAGGDAAPPYREKVSGGDAAPPDVCHHDELLKHYLAARKLIWPDRYCHRWTELIYREIIRNSITILMGAASTQKTAHASEFSLIDYWVYPEETAVLISSVTKEKLEDAVWAEIKKLWREGKERHPWLAGHMIDYKLRIATDDRGADSEEARDLRKGIFCKPCYVNKQWVGLGIYAGIKQKRVRFQCDELQFMAPTFLECLPNMRSNTGAGGLKVIGSGNPKHDPNDQLGMVAEPLEGWPAVDGLEKTTVWPIKLLGGVCVNLIGTDSPNFDQPEDRYPGLIGHEFEKIIAHDYGKDSPKYETQVRGRMRVGLEHSRVITRQLCRLHQAHERALWAGPARTRVYAVDPAYGGGDRCVGGWIEFGEGVEGTQLLRVNPPRILKIVVNPNQPPEDQIADLVKTDLEQYNIPAENCFYDSFGKGTVGFAFARKFGMNPPVPVDAGARTTARPVRHDLWVTEKDGRRRLKRCDEHYSKFITEMWFTVREAIESGQVRELPEDVMAEGCWREYETVAGDKIEVEPKDELKERMGKSPDLFDWLAIAVEGARQRGFKIRRLGADVPVENSTWDWFWQRQEKLDQQRQKHELVFGV
jgi:hypothetical protein